MALQLFHHQNKAYIAVVVAAYQACTSAVLLAVVVTRMDLFPSPCSINLHLLSSLDRQLIVLLILFAVS